MKQETAGGGRKSEALTDEETKRPREARGRRAAKLRWRVTGRGWLVTTDGLKDEETKKLRV